MADTWPITERVYYRCDRCGTMAASYQILPSDDNPPREDCGCYMGPRWVRGIWRVVERDGSSSTPPDTAQSDPPRICGCGECDFARVWPEGSP